MRGAFVQRPVPEPEFGVIVDPLGDEPMPLPGLLPLIPWAVPPVELGFDPLMPVVPEPLIEFDPVPLMEPEPIPEEPVLEELVPAEPEAPPAEPPPAEPPPAPPTPPPPPPAANAVAELKAKIVANAIVVSFMRRPFVDEGTTNGLVFRSNFPGVKFAVIIAPHQMDRARSEHSD